MKIKITTMAVLALTLALAFTGCKSRTDNSMSSIASDAQSTVESNMDEGKSMIESKVEDGKDIISSGSENNTSSPETSGIMPDSSGSVPNVSMPDSSSSMPDTSGTLPNANSMPDGSSPSVPAMSTDFEEIGALDATKKGWGPGRNVDTDKRPLGAIDYQQKYKQYGAYFIAPKTQKIYLTFDQGYENGYTSQILDTLKEKNVKAVFFLTYPYAKAEPELVKRMIAEGHILGNHSTKHLSFPTMSLEDAAADITKLHDYVNANFGYNMTLFRPPMGEFNEQCLALFQSLGYKTIFWSFAYRDWEQDNQPLTIEALDTVTKSAHPGAIYLLHSVSKTNAEILGQAIDDIEKQGYTFSNEIAYF